MISHSIGSRDWEKVNIQVHTALALAVTAGIALTVIGVWAAPLLLGLLNIPETVMTYAVPYIRIYFPWYAADDAFLIWAAPYCALQAIRGPDCTAWRLEG